VNLAWYRAFDGSANPGFDLLTAVPQVQATAEVGLPLPADLSLVMTAFFGSERRNNTRTPLETLRRWQIPAYACVNATLLWQRLPGGVEAQLTLQNALQSDLRDDVPRPDFDRMPGLLPREGLSAWLEVRGRW
jgi:hypothetical protein